MSYDEDIDISDEEICDQEQAAHEDASDYEADQAERVGLKLYKHVTEDGEIVYVTVPED